ncbi:MAG: TMEM175 family protein [Acidobacteriota bacterium]
MTKTRLEAFSDGVIAIIITIMVLELKIPHEAGWRALVPLAPVFLSYVLSFIYLGIYWNNHHHLLQAVKQVDGRVLWANLHLLFWLSLVPFVTGWMGENHFAAWPVALYGAVLFCAAIAYFILAHVLVSLHGRTSVIGIALGRDFKGKVSMVIYLAAIPLAFYRPWLAFALYMSVAAMWLVPDPRIEKKIVD